MKKQFALFNLLFVFGQILHAQTLDITTYAHLVTADKNEFIVYAKSVGLTTDLDTTSQTQEERYNLALLPWQVANFRLK